MATKAHKLLTGSDLHEPKGVAAAPAGQAYISDGAGSGTWTTISTTVGFTTGDVKLTFKTVADAGWVLFDDGTLGSNLSGATHADDSYSPLFQILWNNIPAAWTTVSAGRGGSASADWLANKTITLPRALGRALGIAGAGSGLTSRDVGEYLGLEAVVLTLAQLPTGITSNGANAISVTSTIATVLSGGISDNYTSVAGFGTWNSPTKSAITSTNATQAIAVTSNNTSGNSHENMQPSLFLNAMVKV